jgi:hypothetical protein
MRRIALFLGIATLLTGPALAQTRIEVADIRSHPFSIAFGPHGRLDLRVRSGDVRVVGVEEPRISVEVSGKNADQARDLKVRFEQRNDGARMRVFGGPRNGIQITVRVPSTTDLRARVPFGDFAVEGIPGNKDVELHAGDLTVDVVDRLAYARVDASVYSGEVDADVFGETHGGLFRSFSREGPGAFRLHAHVGAGQLTLR